MYDLINTEVVSFNFSLSKLEEAIESERNFLSKRVDKGNISEAYLHHMNGFLGTIIEFVNETEKLHQAIGTMHQLYQPELDRVGQIKHQLKNAEIENKKLRAWLISHGRNPTELLPYISLSDCNY